MRRTLEILVLSHALVSVVGIVVFALTNLGGTKREVVTQIFVGMLGCQMCLVALWASSVSTWISSAGIVLLGLSLIIPTLGISIGDFSAPTWLIPAFTILTLLTALLILRRWNGTVVRLRTDTFQTGVLDEEGIQFSIRQVMTLTFFVAMILAASRAVRPYFPIVSALSIVVIFCGCFVSIDLAVLWAALGTGSFWKRLSVPAIVSILVIVALTLGIPHRNWGIMVGSQTLFLLISLWIVRTAGYSFLKSPQLSAH